MKVYSETLSISTKNRVELVDITEKVRRAVASSGVSNGIVNVYSLHTTLGLYLNENEPNLRMDVLEFLDRLAPQGRGYHHDTVDANANTFSHLRAILLSNSLSLPVAGGAPVLGTWQSVFAAEFDGPRSRRVIIQVMGE
ncbi:hypothetical protein HRbin01_00885 [archaeon HR01]|nr:hypothetical protein HRbin01_00885 [archaeon HR01]